MYLQSAKPRDIITRMLHNLKEIYNTAEDWQRMIPVQDRQIALNADAWSEYRDRGLAFAELGKATAAVRDFDVYLLNVTDALMSKQSHCGRKSCAGRFFKTQLLSSFLLLRTL